MIFTAGEDATVYVPLIVDGDFVVPDSGSANYIVRGNDGTVIVAPTPVGVSPSTTGLLITVPGADNAITADLENRHIIVTFTVNFQPYRIQQSYKLIPWINMTATADEVRAELGVSTSELPDKDIDLLKSYLELKEELDTAFTDALAAGGLTSLRANKMIVYSAALDNIPSLQLRISQSEKSDDVSASRMAKLDFNLLRADISNKLGQLKLDITNADAEAPTFLVVTAPTDVITGG